MTTLRRLSKDENIIITSPDKGGGISIKKTDYEKKMHDLLDDRNTYEETTQSHIEQEIKTFNQTSDVYSRKTTKQNGQNTLKTTPKSQLYMAYPKLTNKMFH